MNSNPRAICIIWETCKDFRPFNPSEDPRVFLCKWQQTARLSQTRRGMYCVHGKTFLVFREFEYERDVRLLALRNL